jgi:hypothetical protein
VDSIINTQEKGAPMLSAELQAIETIKEIFQLHIFGKPDLLINDAGRLCISWNDDTGRFACGSHTQMLELAKDCDGSLDLYWEKLQAANLDALKP